MINPTKILTYRQALALKGKEDFEEGLEKHELIVTGIEHRKRRVEKRRMARLRKLHGK